MLQPELRLEIQNYRNKNLAGISSLYRLVEHSEAHPARNSATGSFAAIKEGRILEKGTTDFKNAILEENAQNVIWYATTSPDYACIRQNKIQPLEYAISKQMNVVIPPLAKDRSESNPVDKNSSCRRLV